MAVYTVEQSRFNIDNLSKYTSALNFLGGTDMAAVTTVGASAQSLTTLTVAGWFKVRSTGGRLITKAGGLDGYWRLAILNNTFQFASKFTAVGQWAAGSIRPGFWHHVVVTYSFSALSNDPIFYIDGVKQNVLASDSNPTGTIGTDDANLYFGNRSAGSSGGEVEMQNVQIYNRVVTEEEAYQIYKKGSPLSTGCVGHWKFDEGSGTSIVDSTGISGDGTITGTSWSTDVPFAARTAITTRRMGVDVSGQKSLSIQGVDYATFPITPDLTTGFNFALWYRPNQAGNEGIVNWESAADRNGFNLRKNSTGTIGLVGSNGSATVFVLTSTQVLNLRSWYHIAVTYNSSKQVRVYLNGTQILSGSGTITTNATALTIGRRSYQNTFHARALFKDFTFQNTGTAWTAAQVSDLYYRHVIPSGSIRYRMNDNVTDQNGANALTLTGTTYETDSPMGGRTTV